MEYSKEFFLPLLRVENLWSSSKMSSSTSRPKLVVLLFLETECAGLGDFSCVTDFCSLCLMLVETCADIGTASGRFLRRSSTAPYSGTNGFTGSCLSSSSSASMCRPEDAKQKWDNGGVCWGVNGAEYLTSNDLLLLNGAEVSKILPPLPYTNYIYPTMYTRALTAPSWSKHLTLGVPPTHTIWAEYS